MRLKCANSHSQRKYGKCKESSRYIFFTGSDTRLGIGKKERRGDFGEESAENKAEKKTSDGRRGAQRPRGRAPKYTPRGTAVFRPPARYSVIQPVYCSFVLRTRASILSRITPSSSVPRAAVSGFRVAGAGECERCVVRSSIRARTWCVVVPRERTRNAAAVVPVRHLCARERSPSRIPISFGREVERADGLGRIPVAGTCDADEGRHVRQDIRQRQDCRMVRLNASVHPSLSEMVTENLRRRNVITIVDFITADPIKLASFTGLSHTIEDRLFDSSNIGKRSTILAFAGHITNEAAHVEEVQWRKEECNTASHDRTLDELLKGGLYPGQLCELCGPSSSGKTQLCLTIAANVVGRSDVVVWYFDTKKDFSRLRYEEIMRARNFSQKVIEDALHATKVCQVRSSRELIRALRQLVTHCKTEQNDASIEGRKPLLVIIDSLPAVIFQVTRNAQQKDSETIYELDDLAEVCRFLARECQAVVITVNLVTRWNSLRQTDDITPALGKYWARIPATRLLITRRHGVTRRIKVWKDLRLNENSFCIVTVSDIGITS